MGKRKLQHQGVSDLAWRFLHDRASEADRETVEYILLELDMHNAATGYSAGDLWAAYGDQVTAEWIAEHPGTRPTCWWLFESGLERKMRGAMVLPLRASIPENQRAWLEEAELLETGE